MGSSHLDTPVGDKVAFVEDDDAFANRAIR